jgi:hypothetical protein
MPSRSGASPSASWAGSAERQPWSRGGYCGEPLTIDLAARDYTRCLAHDYDALYTPAGVTEGRGAIRSTKASATSTPQVWWAFA